MAKMMTVHLVYLAMENGQFEPDTTVPISAYIESCSHNMNVLLSQKPRRP